MLTFIFKDHTYNRIVKKYVYKVPSLLLKNYIEQNKFTITSISSFIYTSV